MSDHFDFPPAKNEAKTRFTEEKFKELTLETRLSTSRSEVAKRADPLITPIYHSSTYRFDTVKQFTEENHGNNYLYQRCGNPTVENVEVLINEMEGGAATLLYNSGLAAFSAVILEFLSAGDHLVCMKPMYSGTFSFLTETIARFGVEISFVDVEKEKDFVAAVAKATKPNTKMIILEAIANPTMAVPDIKGTIDYANKNNILTFIDSTFASPLNLQPLKLGASINMHSCSKYIGGHSDVIAGCVTTRCMKHWQRLKLQQLTLGNALSPFDAALVARGLKTIVIRVDKINANATAVAQFLDSHPKVTKVFYAALPSHPHHEVAKTVMTSFGGMIGLDVGTADKAIRLIESLKLIVHAVSLGGTESLIEHPATFSHGAQLLRHKDSPTVSPGLIRLSVGIENSQDLINDLRQALEQI